MPAYAGIVRCRTPLPVEAANSLIPVGKSIWSGRVTIAFMVSLGIGGWLLSACSSATNTNALNRERSATSATGAGHAPPPSTSTTQARPVSSTSVPPTTSPVTFAPKTAPSGLQYGPGPQGTYTIEPQPPAGSCHYAYEGSDPLPDLHCTPGALNPLVTQSTIASTICTSGYTSSIRPLESVTEPEKQASASAYSYTGAFSTAEYDHLVPLELGGDPNDPANLWVEPNENPNATSTTNSKDVLEDRLNNLVCSGQLSLATAQEAIASNWVTAYQKYVGTQPSSTPTTSAAPPPTGGASCTASASPANEGYSGDYYVSVNSNQPNQKATASDAGDNWSDYTDSSGYVRILLYYVSPGEQINVSVGEASCSTTA